MLSQRFLAHETLRLSDSRTMVARCELRLEKFLLGAATDLGEPGSFDRAGLPMAHLEVRGATPQSERAPVLVAGTVMLSEGRVTAGARHQLLEPNGVDRARVDAQRVLSGDRVDRVGSKAATDPGDRGAHLLPPRRRHRLAPVRLRKLVRSHRGATSDHQGRQYGTLSRTQMRIADIDGSEHANRHAQDCVAAHATGQRDGKRRRRARRPARTPLLPPDRPRAGVAGEKPARSVAIAVTPSSTTISRNG